jgi:branched-subunit amino acid transport protein
MTDATAWALVGLLAVVTAVIKGAGPFALGGRELPSWFSRVIMFMAPALLSALVVTATFADGDHWAVGEDTAGVAVAGVLLWRGASIIVGVFVAAAITALLRAV